MEHGFLKVAAGTPEIKVADTAFNAEKIAEMLFEAEKQGVELLVFPELSLTGCTARDLFFQTTLLEGALAGLETVLSASKRAASVLAFIGLPYLHEGKLYNAAAAIKGGKILGVVPKTHLSRSGDIFEPRYFATADGAPCETEILGQKAPFYTKLIFFSEGNFEVAAEIGEDLSAPVPPSSYHAQNGAAVIVNLSATPETVGKAERRRILVAAQSARLISGYVYAEAGGGESTTDSVYGGHNIIAENGTVLTESEKFKSGLAVSDIDLERICADRRKNSFPECAKDTGYIRVPFKSEQKKTALNRKVSKNPFIPESFEREKRAELILSVQSEGLKKRLLHTGCKKAFIGLSGGLDSALALLVAVRAFDKLKISRQNICAVTMPCEATTKTTENNAKGLAHALGADLKVINIKKSVKQHFEDIGHDQKIYDTAYENAQARERTQILMDMANKEGGLVVGTGDLSELALGWCTYNGDHMSMYGVNAGVPKTVARELIRAEAENLKGEAERILKSILDTPISPELIPGQEGKIGQRTEELVGPYALHDFFLYYSVRWGFTPEKIMFLAKEAFKDDYDAETIKRWLKKFYVRFFTQQFKRSCLPDGPKVGSVALSPRGSFVMPSDAAMALWIKDTEETKE